MVDRLKDKSAILIGAARGIGAAMAEACVAEGARVVVADTEVEAGRQTAERLARDGDCTFVACDVSDKDSIAALVAETEARNGGVDILVQNAGIYPYTMIPDISVEEWDRVMAVNLRGTFLAAQACHAAMKRRGGGRMVFTSSITGPRVTSPGHGHYSATKAGINGFIRSAAIEFAPDTITVNGIEPGNILTEGVKAHRSAEFIAGMEASVPLGRLGSPRDVAMACVYLASDEAAYVTGTTIIVDGGQILPESKA
ncbi:MAG: SDR family oxidoreductase [Azospirillaceae bacterium]